MRRCLQCSKGFPETGLPESEKTWCLGECYDRWMAAHPEEQVGWVSVKDLNPLQRAELKALLGQGEQA